MRIKHNKRSEFYLKPNELKKLFSNAGSFRNRCIIKLLTYLGLRRFEVAKIDIRDIDFERKRLRVIGKYNKEATLPIPIEIIDDLRYLIEDKKLGWLFPSPSNDKNHISIVQINRILAKAGNKAEIKNPNPDLKNINPHLLRHSYSRILKDKGMGLESIQKLMRHSSIKTTMDMYGTKSIDDVQDEFDEKFSL